MSGLCHAAQPAPDPGGTGPRSPVPTGRSRAVAAVIYHEEPRWEAAAGQGSSVRASRRPALHTARALTTSNTMTAVAAAVSGALTSMTPSTEIARA